MEGIGLFFAHLSPEYWYFYPLVIIIIALLVFVFICGVVISHIISPPETEEDEVTN